MKYYHITCSYLKEEVLIKPSLPYFLQKGEDKETPRICVTTNWRHSLRSIILLRRAYDRFYLYSSEKQPLDPNMERQKLLDGKVIRKNQNRFRLPPDGQVNKELWYTEPTPMTLEGIIEIPKEVRLRMLMGFGFMGDPDVEKLELKPCQSEKFMLGGVEYDLHQEKAG